MFLGLLRTMHALFLPSAFFSLFFHSGVFFKKKFIEAYVIYYKIRLFQVYTSLTFSNFMEWCSHHP